MTGQFIIHNGFGYGSGVTFINDYDTEGNQQVYDQIALSGALTEKDLQLEQRGSDLVLVLLQDNQPTGDELVMLNAVFYQELRVDSITIADSDTVF